MKKRILSFLLAVLLVLPLMPAAGVQAASSGRGELYRLINQVRTEAGLSPLSANSYLNACSTVRIYELFDKFSHTRPDGRDWRTVLEDKNLPVDVAYSGEIICAGQSSATEALNAFMNSPEHKAILMDDKFNFMGVGHGVQNGADYWVVNFTRSNQLQPEDNCFDSDDEGGTPPVTGNVNLSVYYGDVTMKDGKVLLSKDSPFLKCWLHAPRGSYLQSWSVTVSDQQKEPIFNSGEIPEEQTMSSERKALSLAMWKEPENGVLVYPTCRLEPGKSYYYRFDAVVNGKTYSSQYISFIVDGDPVPEAKTYTVTFFNPINAASSTKTVTNGQPYGTLPTPVDVSDYTFEGWYADSSFTQRITADTIVNLTKDQTLYARMVKKPNKTVSLNLKNKTGLSGVETVNPNGGKLEAVLSAPAGCKWAQYTVSIYTAGGSLLKTFKETGSVTTAGADIPIHVTLSASASSVPDGTTLNYGDFKLVAGTTYMYQVAAVVDGKTYTTQRARFRVSSSAGSSTGFTDVKSGIYYADAVKWAVENGITSGIGGGKFAPANTCKREQIVTFLYRSKSSPAVSVTGQFTDMPKNEEFQRAISWAVENNITLGDGKGRFNPEKGCTRAEAMTFIWRAAGKPDPKTTAAFSDMPANQEFCKAISWAVENGIAHGTGNNKFSPNETCRREHIVTFLYNAKDI